MGQSRREPKRRFTQTATVFASRARYLAACSRCQALTERMKMVRTLPRGFGLSASAGIRRKGSDKPHWR